MNFVVAATGTAPNCLKDAVAGGNDRVAEIFPLSLTLADRAPGPSDSEAFGPARKVLPVILYFACKNVAADAGPPAATSVPAATSPTALVAAIRLGHADRIATDI
jgi:hypothetical protein